MSRIVQARCQGCHRTGGVAPFAFEERDDIDFAYPTRTLFIEHGGAVPGPEAA